MAECIQRRRVSGVLTFEGNWLEAAPRNAVLSAADPRSIVVQPAWGTLAPAVYRGMLTLGFRDPGNPLEIVPSQPVEILFRELLAVHRILSLTLTSATSCPAVLRCR